MWLEVFLLACCLFEAAAASVSCGGHRAQSCANCGRQEQRCNGDCRWWGGACLSQEEAAQKRKATDYYGSLGVPRKADDATIKSAYKKKALEFHPDKCTLGKEECDANFILISEAFEVLGDKKLKRIYDKQGIEGIKKAKGESGAGGNPNDIFAQFFNGGGQQQEAGPRENLYDDSDVMEVTGDSWNNFVSKRDDPWLIQFYKPNDEDCREVVEEYKKIGKTFKEFVNVAAVNCRQQQQVCKHNSIGETDHPAVRWFSSDTKKDPEMYQETLSSKLLGKWVSSMMPDFSTVLTSKMQMREWLDSKEGPAVVLFTDKKEIPPMWKALSSEYKERVRMGAVLRCDKNGVFKTELQREFDVRVPGIIRVDPLGPIGAIAEKFELEMKKDKLSLWLRKVRLVSKKEGPTASFKEWTRNRVEAGDCGPKDSQFCFIWLKGGMDKKVEAAMRSLAEKYRTDPIKMMWVGIELNPSVLDAFGLEDAESSDFFIAYRSKRGKFKVHEGELEFKELDTFVDGVLNGGRPLTGKVQAEKLEL